MSLWKRLFDKKKEEDGFGLDSPNHPAHELIVQASRLADEIVKVSFSSNRSLLQVDTKEVWPLIDVIDKAIDASAGDLDLLVAKSAALCCAAQFTKAEEIIDEVLTIDENHFEARMRKSHWKEWDHVFLFPGWFASSKTLKPGMAQLLSLPHQMQVIRDGLQTGIAVVMRADPSEFARKLSDSMSCAWLPIWSKTPYGIIVAHYLVVKDDPANPYKGEGFLPVSIPDVVNSSAGYWLIQRLAHVGSCFLVLTDGKEVFFNKRYVFPKSLRASLETIARNAAQGTINGSRQDFQDAIQWYQNHCDISSIQVDISG